MKTLSPPQEKSVFELVKKQRSPAKSMEVVELLKPVAEKQGVPVQQLYSNLADAVTKDPKFRIMRANNTLFFYYNLGNGQVQIAMETLDNPRTLVESLKDYFKAMKLSGFRSGAFDVQNPQILKAIEMTGSRVSTKSSNKLLPDGKTPMLLGTVEF